MKWLYLIPVFLVFYAISVTRTKRAHDKWLLPWEWINGIWLAFFGTMPFINKGMSGDSKFMDLTADQAYEAHAYASEMMIQEGIVYPEAYVRRQFDCENFAQAMKHYFDVFISREYEQEGVGIPTRIMGYNMDDGRVHAIVVATVEGKPVYYNGYPRKGETLDLSTREIASLTPVVNG